MRSAMMAAGLIGLACCLPARGAMYTFDELYHGGDNFTLAGGSDDPVGQSIDIGDQIHWSITAQGGVWTVDTGDTFWFLMAYALDEVGTRTGDFTLTLLLNGSDVYSSTESGAVNEYVHIGANDTTLATGLKFDQLVLDYTLTDSDSTTTIQQLGPIFGAPENNDTAGISYAVVPEPGSIAMVAMGLAAGGGVVVRRRRSRRDA